MEEKEKIPGTLLTLTAGVAITLFSLWYGQNHHLMPEQASLQAPLVDELFDVMMTVGTALFFVVEGAIVLALFRFRRRRGESTDAQHIKGNVPLEIFWTAIPAVIVIALGIYSVDVYTQMGGFALAGGHQHGGMTPMAMVDGTSSEPPSEAEYGFGEAPATGNPDVVVDVTGMQFAWIFNYADSGVTAGELHIPVGKKVRLNMSAVDVLHAFWVPQFRLKQDVIPGQKTQLSFVATKLGTYPVVCAELCGSYHGAMRTQVIVHTPEEYQTWLQENQAVATVEPTKEATIAKRLASYTQEIGINPETLAQINPPHSNHS